MTDELNKDRKGGCGHRPNKAEWDSSLVADVLDIVKIQDIKACTTQPIWFERMGSIRCPRREIQRDIDRFGKEFPGHETPGRDRRA